jgi:galactokinase
MTGAGFGGCAVALVDEKKASVFETTVSAQYQSITNLHPHIYICQATDGAAVWKRETP